MKKIRVLNVLVSLVLAMEFYSILYILGRVPNKNWLALPIILSAVTLLLDFWVGEET